MRGVLATIRHGKNLDVRKPTLITDPISPKNSQNRREALQNDTETLGIRNRSQLFYQFGSRLAGAVCNDCLMQIVDDIALLQT